MYLPSVPRPLSGRTRRVRRGLATLELAILLPVILSTLCGLYEIGRLIQTRQTICTAAKEAGRQASLGKKITSSTDPAAFTIKRDVIRYLTQAGLMGGSRPLTSNDVTVEVVNASGAAVNPTTLTQSDPFRIRITVPFSKVKIININYKVLGLTNVVATADWQSMKDIPATEDQLQPPVE